MPTTATPSSSWTAPSSMWAHPSRKRRPATTAPRPTPPGTARARRGGAPPAGRGPARDGGRAPAPAWQRYAGRYRNRWGDVQVLLVDDGLLFIEPSLPDPLAMATRLHPIEGREHTFRAEEKDSYGSHGETVVFELGPDG